MGVPVLILGKSGSGKTTSLRNFQRGEIGIINVLGKQLPFNSNLGMLVTDDYTVIKTNMLQAKRVKSFFIDDAGYLITNAFMRGHGGGKGNAVFELYNSLADNFWNLILFISNELPKDMIVYLAMHEDKNEFGDVKPKTIGKLLDDKVCVEGMFTIVIRSLKEDGKYLFVTQTDGYDVTKTPLGMFEYEKVDNDLKIVDQRIRSFYHFDSEAPQPKQAPQDQAHQETNTEVKEEDI